MALLLSGVNVKKRTIFRKLGKHTSKSTGFAVSIKSPLTRATVRPKGILAVGVYVTDLTNTTLVGVYATETKQNETKVQDTRFQVFAEMFVSAVRKLGFT